MKKKLIVILTAAVLAFCLAFTASAYAKGDVDNDGKVTAADARLCLRQSVHIDSCSEGDDVYKACDVNREGGITVADARLILRVAVALDKPFTEDEEETTIPEETTAAHVHSWDAGTVTKAATCSETGIKTYKCSCGETKTETIAINPDAHSYETVTVAATCTSDGYTGRKCKLCGNVIKDTVLPKDANAHKYETVEVEASCLNDGYSIEKCAYCGDTKTDTYKKTADALGHDPKTETIAATCTEPAKTVTSCQRCEAVLDIVESGKALGHKGLTVTPATCTEEGSRTGTCTVCGASVTESISMTAHTIKSRVVKGSADKYCSTEYYCSKCGEIFRTVANSGHNMIITKTTNATCTTPTIHERKCRYCSYTDTIDNDDTLGHSLTPAETKAATCTEDGYAIYSGTCERCGEDFGTNTKVIIPAKGHKIKDGDIATCTHAVICKRSGCGETVTPALGHDYSVSATGLSGAQYFYCSRCGALRDDTLDAFNTLVNGIKLNNYISSTKGRTFTWLDKQTTSSTYSKFDFGAYTSTVKNLYEDEMADDTVEYTPLYQNDGKYYNIQKRYSPFVSNLTEDNIDSIKVERITSISGNTILSGFDTTYKVGNTDYSLANYKTDTDLAGGKGVIKVTVDVKDDILKKDGGNVNYNDSSVSTNLSKVFSYISSNSDIRDDLKEYDSNWQHTETEGSSDDGYEIKMDMTLQEIRENCTVVYYFNAETMEPIAANYTVTKVVDQSVSMKMTIGIMTINGTIEPVITTTDNYVYIFN